MDFVFGLSILILVDALRALKIKNFISNKNILFIFQLAFAASTEVFYTIRKR